MQQELKSALSQADQSATDSWRGDGSREALLQQLSDTQDLVGRLQRQMDALRAAGGGQDAQQLTLAQQQVCKILAMRATRAPDINGAAIRAEKVCEVSS